MIFQCHLLAVLPFPSGDVPTDAEQGNLKDVDELDLPRPLVFQELVN